MQDLFNESPDAGQGSPDMLMGGSNQTLNPMDFRYRVERFALGGSDELDESNAMEALLTRSLHPDVHIVDRKDSISATTGVYTCVIIYMERRPTQGDNDA